MSLRFSGRAAAALAVAAIFTSLAGGQTTVTFQPGVAGYNGLTEVYIGLAGNVGGPDGNVVGSTVEDQFMDGRYNTDSDTQGLYRFDGIFNTIPANATIINATFTLVTSEVGNAASGGPYAVSQLLTGFDETTTYNDAMDGFRFGDGEAERPVADGFIGLDPGDFGEADVTKIVQAWVDGDPNLGFVVTAGTTNGWSVFTSGFSEASLRPELSVTFTTDKQPMTQTAILTQSPADPSNSMFEVDTILDIFIDGDTILPLGEFLDGGDADTQALIRFDEIFQGEGGPVPDDAVIVNAWLIVNTSPSQRSFDAGTGGEYGIRQILTDWDGSSSFFELSFGPFVDTEFAMIADTQTEFNVTSVVEDFQMGVANFGFNLATTATTDGWAILYPTGIAPPQLKISWVSDEVLLGDINCDGVVSLLDVTPFVNLISSGGFSLKADINQDGVVNLQDVSPFVSLLSGG